VPKKKAVKILALAALPALAAGILLIPKTNAAKTPFQTEILARGDIEALVATTGTISALDTVDIGSQVSGRIARLGADFNSRVTSGQIMAEIDPDPLRAKVDSDQADYEAALAALEKARVTLTTARNKWERTRELFDHHLVSREDEEAAESDYKSSQLACQVAEEGVVRAERELDLSRTNLSYAVIRSPIDGTVINRAVSVGQTVAAGFQAPVLFQVASDLAKMQVECNVDEADIGRVKEGNPAVFTVQAFPDEEFSAVVRQVRFSATTTENVVTYAVIMDVSNPELKLRPGMTASVSILTGVARGVLLVPNAALGFTPSPLPTETSSLAAEMRRQSGKGHSIVWIVEGTGEIRPYVVKTGLAGKMYTELAAGDLREGQKIIVNKGSSVSTRDDFPPPPPMGGPPPPPPPGR
jgi:HlyD family secretion protein